MGSATRTHTHSNAHRSTNRNFDSNVSTVRCAAAVVFSHQRHRARTQIAANLIKKYKTDPKPTRKIKFKIKHKTKILQRRIFEIVWLVARVFDGTRRAGTHTNNASTRPNIASPSVPGHSFHSSSRPFRYYRRRKSSMDGARAFAFFCAAVFFLYSFCFCFRLLRVVFHSPPPRLLLFLHLNCVHRSLAERV